MAILCYCVIGDKNMSIYQRIKELRLQQGMSQQELAEKVGYKTASAINKIELGLRDVNLTKIVLFANALKTTPSYLIGYTEEKKGLDTEANPILETKEILRLLAALPEEKLAEAVRYLKYLSEN